jgi:phosphomannomutase
MAAPGMLELPLLQPEPQYVCPGEDYAISRAVHLSRLAAYYPKCRECVHRHDTAQLVVQTVEKIEASNRRTPRATLFTDEGVRGVYLNELTATKAGEIAGAFASLLWEATPLEIRHPQSDAVPPAKRAGPHVVIAHDERPSSPDLITGVAKILRRMGCHVIDIGLATRPCFWFAVEHLQAAAGIQVAGSGHDPAWTGLDFVGLGAIPIEHDNQLPAIASRLADGYQRPMRFSAGQRTFHCGPLYEAGLQKHFHALRPLKVCLGCPNRPVRDVLVRLFQKLACPLILVNIPVRQRQILNPDDVDAQRMRSSVQEHGAHFGLLIDDDGQTCGVFDERGELAAPRQITLLLADLVLAETRHSRIVLEQTASAALLRPIDRRNGFVAMADASRSSVALAMREADASFAGGDSGRYWFRESMPTCDAVLTLAKLLQALSRSDAEMSLVLSRL